MYIPPAIHPDYTYHHALHLTTETSLPMDTDYNDREKVAVLYQDEVTCLGRKELKIKGLMT